jgi:isopenicillin N synthase-like dioxygenase
MTDIPVIDIGPFLAGADAVTAPAAVEAAATSLGFLQVVGHGIPVEALDGAYDAMARLSGLPQDAKRAHLSDGHPYRGLHLNRDASGAVRQERFLVSRFDGPTEAMAGGVPPELADFFFPNIWPDLAGFRAGITELFRQTHALAAKMMSLLAVGLGLERGYFEPVLEPNASTFAVNHYPARGEPFHGADVPVLFAEHADGNTLTILHQRGSYNGLQIRILDRAAGEPEWLDIPVVEEAFVINVGELMTRWTNDHWPSTRHRVVASREEGDSRTTLTTFHMPALGARVAPLPVWGGVEDPHYEAVTPYEWERTFMAKNYERRALEVDPKVQHFVESLRS